ncbi:cytochrome P450 [Phanerochaete sordida]|uniref:Cytochrome P450 n=1 Tax=Phanerochaete sordida TaxID=48140 RepID=A0A9P3GDJ5_9APHY|nr:cytochrome P450 [Phanerochaete sordida]
MGTVGLVLLSFVVVYCVKKYIDYRAVLHSIGNHPGYRTLFPSYGIYSFIFKKPIPGITRGGMSSWKRKHRDFAEFGMDVVSLASVIPTPRSMLLVADAAAIKEITSSRTRFPKPVKQYKVLTFFGANIVTAEGDEWKRFRKITAPAFSERNNRLVWDETVKIMVDLFENVWGEQKVITTDHAIEVTLPIALFVIGVAGFGRQMTWQEDAKLPAGHTLTFKEALHTVSTGVFVKLATPAWMLRRGLTQRMRETNVAFRELEQYMLEMIQARRSSEKKEERYDLFSNLLDASEDDEGQPKLADSELLGNIFIFLLAGHETTAHTLCFTFGLLALYPEQQEKLYQHIKSVLPSDRVPTYEEMNSLSESVAVFYETLRLYPPVTGIPKIAAEDTTLVATDYNGNKITIPVPEGSGVTLHVPGLHYNPRYWDDPYEFKPERFRGDWPRDAFLPFSAGARSCLGRRFFETEGIAILTMLVSRYKIEVKEEPEFASETFEERKERILAARGGLTLTPIRTPLVFKRR